MRIGVLTTSYPRFEGDVAGVFVRGMARALADMLDHEDVWPIMRERAQAFIASERDWQINSRRYHAVYHRLLGKPLDRSPNSAAWMAPDGAVHARNGGSA